MSNKILGKIPVKKMRTKLGEVGRVSDHDALLIPGEREKEEKKLGGSFLNCNTIFLNN